MKKFVLPVIVMAFAFSVIDAPSVNAQNYQRVTQAANVPPPVQNRNNNFAYNGYEVAPYAYGYSFNLPDDGKWRYIEPRCYESANGQTCVDGHWVRKEKGKCEQVTQHSVKQGNYTRVVSGGKVNTCRD